jgi:S1-C subfamily serine protease
VLHAEGRVVGMTVSGPRRTVLAIPSATIERVGDQLVSRGRIARGYLGLGLQPVRLDDTQTRSLSLSEPRALIVVSVDPNGPGAGAGLLLGDVIAKWDGEPVRRVREILRRLGSDSVGRSVELTILRAGQLTSAGLTIGERPSA